MNRLPKKINQTSVDWANNFAKEAIDRTIERALSITTDYKKKERRAASLCKSCFYVSSKIGGAAMTEQPCGICEESQMYSSTATDVICLKCALKNELCKRCGADVEIRMRRKFSSSASEVV